MSHSLLFFPVSEDLSRIFVAVGYGFFVEMKHDEALRFIDKKTSQLTAFTETLTKDSAKIKANIRMVLEGLRELQGLTDLPESRRRDVF
ncbi:protein UXT [Etheostoma cragini]|uniref:protein UXT n=1 Tax=Etheostoma cragini TaxID=417921 RepID=UPI00155E0C6F|nr:protein UXT [Etheostoma cragini]